MFNGLIYIQEEDVEHEYELEQDSSFLKDMGHHGVIISLNGEKLRC